MNVGPGIWTSFHSVAIGSALPRIFEGQQIRLVSRSSVNDRGMNWAGGIGSAPVTLGAGGIFRSTAQDWFELIWPSLSLQLLWNNRFQYSRVAVPFLLM